MAKIRYLDRKALVRKELISAALSGNVTTYSELGRLVGIPKQGPWKPLLDIISNEETSNDYPDITFWVKNVTTNYPGQIGFIPAGSKISPKQKQDARNAVQGVINLYCPGTPNPY